MMDNTRRLRMAIATCCLAGSLVVSSQLQGDLINKPGVTPASPAIGYGDMIGSENPTLLFSEFQSATAETAVANEYNESDLMKIDLSSVSAAIFSGENLNGTKPVSVAEPSGLAIPFFLLLIWAYTRRTRREPGVLAHSLGV